MAKRKLKGQRFHKLLVLEEHPERIGNGDVQWLCKCDCGMIKVIRGTSLLSGTWSCGCLKDGHPVHGLAFRTLTHKLYVVWVNMKQRCNNPNATAYPDYGGRGIRVCPEWESDAKVFYDFAMANGWEEGLQTDRIDNDQGYFPDNVRFVTAKVNQNNKYRAKRRTNCLPSFG